MTQEKETDKRPSAPLEDDFATHLKRLTPEEKQTLAASLQRFVCWWRQRLPKFRHLNREERGGTMLRWMIEWLLGGKDWQGKVARAVIVAAILAAIFLARYLEHLEAVR